MILEERKLRNPHSCKYTVLAIAAALQQRCSSIAVA